VEEMKNLDQVQDPIKELLWFVQTTRLWTCIVNRGLKNIVDDA
jgi:hypothetical protein